VLAFIRHDPGESDPGSIIDGDVDILEAGASDQIAAIAGDAVTGPLDPSQFLDVEVDELAWVLALITADRRRRLEQSEPVELMATEEARDGGFGEAALARNLEAGQTQPAQRQNDRDLRRRRLPGTAMRT